MDLERYESNMKKVDKIAKKINPKNMFLDMLFVDYNDTYLYLYVSYLKKYDCFRMYWFDLDEYDPKQHEKYENSQIVHENFIKNIVQEYNNTADICVYNDESGKLDNMVYLHVNVPTKNSDSISMNVRRYVPAEYIHLSKLYYSIACLLPADYSSTIEDLFAGFNGDTEKFLYREEIEFDLFEGNLKDIFKPEVINRGEKYYKKNKVRYIEKIEGSYVAYVNGTEDDYVIFVDYNEETKKLLMTCSCPCEFYCKHMYAVIKAIRNNETKKFAKVTFGHKDIDMVTMIENFKYYLCVACDDTCLYLINDFGEIEPIEIYDEDNNCNWKILADSCDKILSDLK